MDLSESSITNARAFKPVVERAFEAEFTDEECLEHLVTLGIQYLVCRLVDPQKPSPSVATVMAIVDRDPPAFAHFLTEVLDGERHVCHVNGESAEPGRWRGYIN